MTPRDFRLKAAEHIYGPGLEIKGGPNRMTPSVRGFVEFGTAPEWAGSSASFTEMIELAALLEGLLAEHVAFAIRAALRKQLEELRAAFGSWGGPESLAAALLREAEERIS